MLSTANSHLSKRQYGCLAKVVLVCFLEISVNGPIKAPSHKVEQRALWYMTYMPRKKLRQVEQ